MARKAQYIALGYLPANYHLAVPTDAATQTFAFGPQFDRPLTLEAHALIRPSLGALRERAVPHAQDAFQTVIVSGLRPAGFKLDWTGFYGVGGGAEGRPVKHIGIRGQFDFVYNHPFNDIIGRWPLDLPLLRSAPASTLAGMWPRVARRAASRRLNASYNASNVHRIRADESGDT